MLRGQIIRAIKVIYDITRQEITNPAKGQVSYHLLLPEHLSVSSIYQEPNGQVSLHVLQVIAGTY